MASEPVGDFAWEIPGIHAVKDAKEAVRIALQRKGV